MNSNNSTALQMTPMSIPIGTYTDGRACQYDLARAANFNVCVLGMSGAGKTHNIRRLSQSFCENGMTVFVCDVQGDLACIPGSVDIPFRYRSAHGSVNPLRVDVDPEGGGVDMAIRQAIHVIRMFSPQMGTRQEADLRALLDAAFYKAGVRVDDRTTWENPAPTLKDVLDQAQNVLVRITDGVDKNVYALIEKNRSRVNRLMQADTPKKEPEPKKADAAESPDANQEKEDSEYDKAVAKLTESVEKLVREGLKGKLRERRWDKNRLESLIHILEGIVATGLFNGDDMEIRRHQINRFDLTKLHKVDQQVMLHLLLERCFEFAKRTCKHMNPSTPHLAVVLDEGKYATAWMQDMLSPLNRIATEGRKYGCGLIMGVQSLRHLSEDASDNFGMSLVLKLSDKACERAARIFRVPESLLDQIQPRRDGLYSFNGSRFARVILEA